MDVVSVTVVLGLPDGRGVARVLGRRATWDLVLSVGVSFTFSDSSSFFINLERSSLLPMFK